MNAIISLCHFCELHGPKVLFCTQPIHPEEKSGIDHEVDTKEQTVPRVMSPTLPASEPQTPTAPAPSGSNSLPNYKNDLCEGCTSVHLGFVSHDEDAEVSYVSTQRPHHRDVFAMVRQACVRSLSCEVCPGNEGPIFFGDDQQGHAISYTFYIKDNEARGMKRLYSILVVMMDKIYLLNSWPFLVRHMKTVVEHLQTKAEVVYKEEQVKNPQRSHRLVSSVNPKNYINKRGGNKPARSLIELTDDRHIFKILHTAFVWILKACGNRLSETLLEGPPTEDSIIDMEKQEETEEGFVKLFKKELGVSEDVEPAEEVRTEVQSVDEQEVTADDDSPEVKNIRHLVQLIGPRKFSVLAHHTIVGNQVIVRGNGTTLVKTFLAALTSLLPKGCYRAEPYKNCYIESYRCNLLGLPPSISIPPHVNTSEVYLVVDVFDPEPSTAVVEANPFHGYRFQVSSSANIEKAPSVLSKMEYAIRNENLSNEVVEQFLLCLKEEWMNKVKVLFKFTKAGGSRSDDDSKKLFQVIGAKKEDEPLLKFWMTGLSDQYKKHILAASLGKDIVS